MKQEKEQIAITSEIKKQKLESALYRFFRNNNFLGNLVSELTIKYNSMIPTALIAYNKKSDTFEIQLGTEYFCNLELPQRIAVLHHEVLHFTHQHLFRYEAENKPKEEHRIFNIAADMSINQYINDLPEGTVRVQDWKLKDGKPFPLHKTMEEYFQLLNEDHQAHQKEKNGEKMKPGEGSQNGEQWEKYAGGNNFDEHQWESLSEEEKQRMLTEAKKLIQRSIEKTRFGHDAIPDHIKELMQDIDTELSKLDYKGILKRAIKRSVSCADRESTWKKGNKRYGMYAPGTTLGKLPKLDVYHDTSGSISWIEANKFLDVMDGFLKVGARQCMFGMWHTDLYRFDKYKLGQRVKQEEIQSGGTDVLPVLENIKKRNPDLAIILTDGYFGQHDIKLTTEVIWIISEEGTVDHPMKHIGKTIKLSGLINK